MKQKNQPSLYSKISQSYIVIISALLILGAVSYSDLLFLEKSIQQGNAVTLFEETILEIRREEKNLFLYQSENSLTQINQYIDQALSLLEAHQQTFQTLPNDHHAATVKELLLLYRQTVHQWPEIDHKQLRSIGHKTTTIAEESSQQERAVLAQATQRAQLYLLLTLLVISAIILFVSHRLRSSILLPLKGLENNLRLLPKGELTELPPPSNDREFVIFTDCFNQTLRELELSRKRIQQSEKLASLGNLAAGIAHELNNPLSNISTSSQLLIEELEYGAPKQLRVWLQQIIDETERGQTIIQSLLDYGGQRDLPVTPCSLLTIINETALMVNQRIEQAKASLSLNIPRDIVLPANKPKLQQVFINLIENALDAGATHLQLSASRFSCGKEILPDNAAVAGSLNCSGREAVEILLSDNGEGVPSDQVPYLFEPFYSSKLHGKGTGLGLHITHEIVRDHHGCIAIDSNPKQGTRITLLLPMGANDG